MAADTSERLAGEIQRGFNNVRVASFERPNVLCRQMAPEGAVCIHVLGGPAMLVRRSKTELDHGGADMLQRGIRRDGFMNQTFVAASRKPQRGDIAMALEANGKWFCKVVHTENGRTWTRRIHILMVQTSDGKLHYLQGKDLPDSISLYSGVPYSGAHLAEVLLSPKDAKATPLLPAASGWICKRDVFYVALGFFFLRLIQFLAEEVAVALI